MRGNDLLVVIMDSICRRAQRLTMVKRLIVLGLCTLGVVLPVCFARSHNGATTPISHLDSSLTQPSGSLDTGSDLVLYSQANTPSRQTSGKTAVGDLNASANGAVLQAWNRSAGAADASVESFTTYPSPLQHAVSSAANEKRQLVEEIQRRLALMRAGGGVLEAQKPDPAPQQPKTVSEAPSPNRPLGLDADAQLQLFQTVGRIAPGETPPPSKEVAPIIDVPSVTKPVPTPLETPVVQKPPEPNVVPGPQAQAAFEQHCKAARLYQQQGQYVRAADAFALALAYRPNDANAYLGKAHAMLAAGQYPGSGTALAKAVELDPKGALRKVDLVGIAGGPDRFIACFTDLAQYAEAHSSPEQHFLLAYIYYQMDQLDQARAAIEAAQAGSSSPAAVGFLRAAISH